VTSSEAQKSDVLSLLERLRDIARRIIPVRHVISRLARRSTNRGKVDEWRRHFERELAKIRALPDDNGTWGPNRPQSSVIEEVSKIERDDIPLPNAAATSGGAVGVSWLKSGQEFSVFRYPDSNEFEWLLRSTTGTTESGTAFAVGQIAELIDRF
jgi:hypothetical protein